MAANSSTRRLSISAEDVQRRIHPEKMQQQGQVLGAVGKWLEQEWDYQKAMLPGIDNMWLLLNEDSDFNPVCASIFTFEQPIDTPTLLERWTDMCERYPAYRQRPVGLGRRFHTARLEFYPGFDPAEHVSERTLPEGANGKRALEDAMAEFVARDWDLSRALWEVVILRGYEDETGAKCAMMCRAHHTLSDGQGFVMSQLSTTSLRARLEKMQSNAAKTERALENGGAKLSDLPVPALKPHLRVLDPYVPSLLVSILFWCLWATLTFISLLYGLFAGARAGVRYLMFARKDGRYSGPRVYEKEFSFSDAVKMEDIKLVQKAFGTATAKVTLNDVMCAVVSKAIGEYYEQRGAAKDKRIALFIPISVRSATDPSMGNYSTGMIAYFPRRPPHKRPLVGQSSRTRALIHACHDEMRSLKSSYWPRLTFAMLAWFLRAPVFFPSTQSRMLEEMLESVHGVLTNVPGPPETIDVAGCKVLRWTASPPQAGKGTLGIGMITYGGSLVWTVTADSPMDGREHFKGVARKLTRGFVAEFEKMVQEARDILDR